MSSELLELFNADDGIVCCVGAGGKKTTMFQLAKAHPGRVGITATAHIEYFPKTLPASNYIGTEEDILTAVRNDKSSEDIAFAKPSERFGRRAGISMELLKTIKDENHFGLIVVKADGARGKLVKAPAEHEPPVPVFADTVIPVVSVKVIGMALTDKVAHRVERFTNITGLNEHDEIKPVHIARLLSSSDGSLKNTGSAKVIPLINMVDYLEQETSAREAAKQALTMTDRFDYIVLAAMKEDQPIIDVISR